MKRAGTASLTLCLVAGGLTVGCGDQPDAAAPTDPGGPADPGTPATPATPGGVATANGLTAINGLSATNGLTALNGLSATNGLTATNGLSSAVGLMTTEAGRATVSYLVRCALPAGRSITKQDQLGASHTFAGSIGVAPEWETGACDVACQEAVSACMMAHINTSGQRVGLWLDAPIAAIGWGYTNQYPFQESAFFGNIFVTPPSANYCNGTAVSIGTVAGRIGADQVGAPYANPFGSPGTCADACAPSAQGHILLYGKDGTTNRDLQTQYPDGYVSCAGWTRVITVYRDFAPATDYQICSAATGLCLGIKSGRTNSGAATVQVPYTGDASQKFHIVRSGQGGASPMYQISSVKSGLYLCGLASGRCEWPARNLYESQMAVQQIPLNDFKGQFWYLLPTGKGTYVMENVYGGAPLGPQDGSIAPGATVDLLHNPPTRHEWTILPAS